jgi:hypothetical protein
MIGINIPAAGRRIRIETLKQGLGLMVEHDVFFLDQLVGLGKGLILQREEETVEIMVIDIFEIE